MKQDDVLKARQMGFSFVCSLCTNLHKMFDCKLNSCSEVAQVGNCSGPLRGNDFPSYNGPLRDGQADYMGKFCFVCGTEKIDGVVKTAGQKVFGICKEHKDIFTFSSENERPPRLNEIRVEGVGGGYQDGLYKDECKEERG